MLVLFSAFLLLGLTLDGDSRHGMQVAALLCFVAAGWFACWAFDCLQSAEAMDAREVIEGELNEHARWCRANPDKCASCKGPLAENDRGICDECRREYGPQPEEDAPARTTCLHCGETLTSPTNLAGIFVPVCTHCVAKRILAGQCVRCLSRPRADGAAYFCAECRGELGVKPEADEESWQLRAKLGLNRLTEQREARAADDGP